MSSKSSCWIEVPNPKDNPRASSLLLHRLGDTTSPSEKSEIESVEVTCILSGRSLVLQHSTICIGRVLQWIRNFLTQFPRGGPSKLLTRASTLSSESVRWWHLIVYIVLKENLFFHWDASTHHASFFTTFKTWIQNDSIDTILAAII